MALYDYRCLRCGELFEAEHPMAGPDPRLPIRCPVCETAEVNKIYLDAPAVKIWFKSPRLAHHAEEKRPRYMPSILAKREVGYGEN